MSAPLEPGSGIVVQAPINVPLLTYDWNVPDQMWELWLFKHQFTSWKTICQIMSDAVHYLLSILGKEGNAAMDQWMATDPADKNDAENFLNYLERTLDGEISPHVRVYELEDIKKRTHETIDTLINLICQLPCCALIGVGVMQLFSLKLSADWFVPFLMVTLSYGKSFSGSIKTRVSHTY